jgi:DNA-binding transcriptional ArsR family regulator
VDLEDVFSSKPRVKILKMLYNLGSLNVSEIARRLKMNYASTAEHLRILEAEGVLLVHTYGRVKMYRFNEGSLRAKAVVNLIEVWEQKP